MEIHGYYMVNIWKYMVIIWLIYGIYNFPFSWECHQPEGFKPLS